MVRSSLTSEAVKTLVHPFVSSRLDYCNIQSRLLYGISDGLLTKLQTVQNAAVRVVTGTRKFDHITPVLRQLHWLPVRQRITFKLAMIVYRNAFMVWRRPTWLTCVSPFRPSSAGGSCGRRRLVVPRTRTTIGRRDFAVSGPATWNSLPVELRTSTLSIETFVKKNSKVISSAASASADSV